MGPKTVPLALDVTGAARGRKSDSKTKMFRPASRQAYSASPDARTVLISGRA